MIVVRKLALTPSRRSADALVGWASVVLSGTAIWTALIQIARAL